MKLLTHNHLLCIYKGCKSTEALTIEATLVSQVEMEPKLDFVAHMLKVVNYDILRKAAKEAGISDLPPRLPPMEIAMRHEGLLSSLQRVLLQTNVKEGFLRCESCGTRYRIMDGVVNMKDCIRGMHSKTADTSDITTESSEDKSSMERPLTTDGDSSMLKKSEHDGTDELDEAEELAAFIEEDELGAAMARIQLMSDERLVSGE